VKETKPCPLAQHELQLALMAVVEHLVVMLCLFDSFADLHQKLIAVTKLRIHRQEHRDGGSRLYTTQNSDVQSDTWNDEL
jgi:hypothetical protein